MMEIRYEDLVDKPEQTMRAVLDFIGEPWEEDVARFQGESTEFLKVKSLTGKSSTTLESLAKPLMRNRVGIWKNEVAGQSRLHDLENIIDAADYGAIWNNYKFQEQLEEHLA